MPSPGLANERQCVKAEVSTNHGTSVTEPIPLVDLKSNYRSVKEEIDAAITRVLDSCYFIGSPDVKNFESEFAKWIGVNHAVGLNSGTDALFLAMKFLGIGEGDEVLIPGNTFIATCLGASNNGASIVLVDNDPDTYMIDVTKIECKITAKTKAIVPVHLYGHCVDMDPLMALAKKYDLFVIEDAAQAHGAEYKGKRAGSFGDFGCFSFYPGKNLGAFGDGGAIVTNNDDFVKQIRAWQSWGAVKKYHHELKGGNSRLDSIQAAVLNVKLRYMDAWNEKRRVAAALYSQLLESLEKQNKLKLPTVSAAVKPVWHLFVIQVDKRDELLAYLNKAGIGAGAHYPIPIHKTGAYKELNIFEDELPHCANAAPKLLSLPLFPEITSDQIERIVGVIQRWFEETRY